MTTLDLSRFIGLEVPYSTGPTGLTILVKILDCKRSYGQATYLVTPLAGSRCLWVRSGLELPADIE